MKPRDLEAEKGKEEIEKLIWEWYGIAHGKRIGQTDPVFRFVALWIAFNALYQSKLPGVDGDRSQISEFSKNEEVNNEHQCLIQRESKYRKAIEVIKNKGVFNIKYKKQETIRNERNFQEVAICLYQIRCNLFHGGKTPSNIRDIELIKAACKILSMILGRLLR